MSAPDRLKETPATDISTLIGIGKPGVWAILGLFVAGQIAFTLTTLDAVESPWPSLLALVVVAVAALPLALPHSDPFPLRWSSWILLATLVATALISWQLSDEGTIGREAWHHGANTWLLFFLALRGRPGVAWLGFLGMTAVTEVWALDVGRGAFEPLTMLQTHAGILLVGTLFARALRRASARINSLNLRSIDLAAAAATADAEQEIRQERVAELAEVATPLLGRISRSVMVSDDDRLDYLLAEATLRDSVRARGLHLPEIIKATTAARKRGVEVTLLDDRGGGLPTEAAMRLLTDRITEYLRHVDEGRLTIRLAPPGREVAASLVVESRGQSRRIDLNEAGMTIDSSSPG
ncbi:MAG: hypothetical protein JW722_02990 [Demequinaceae bacterium]|nr:hypothetical protein [Demequinaceae bacterium]